MSAPAIAYGQLGILLELLWRGERSAFAKCDFCQTLNHRFATRCEACAGKLGAAYSDSRGVHDAEPRRRGPRGGSAVQWRELSRMMLWVLAMPLLLFVLFTIWQQWRLSSMRASTLQPPALATAAPARTGVESALSGMQAPATNTASASPPVPAADQLARLAPVAEPEQQIQADAQPVARPLPASDPRAVVLATPPSRSERAHLVSASPRIDRSDPTAACEGKMFLMRAICVNRRCAEPQNASRGRCVEAVRQRRIEEARRNQTPMG